MADKPTHHDALQILQAIRRAREQMSPEARERARQEWLEENREAIQAYNERIKRDGVSSPMFRKSK